MPYSRLKILACIDDHPKSIILLKSAANRAASLGCEWGMLYVETPSHYALSQEARERILRHTTFAQEMGAKVIQIQANNAGDAIVDFIQESGTSINHVVIGQTERDGLSYRWRSKLTEKLPRRLRSLDIRTQIIPLSDHHYAPSWFERLHVSDIHFADIRFAFFAVLCAFLSAELLRVILPPIEWHINKHNATAFFLIACVITSLRHGLFPGLIAAIFGFTIMNYYYIAPLYDFGIEHSGDSISLLLFLFSSITVATLGAYSRSGRTALARKEKRSRALFEVHRIANQATDRAEVLALLHRELSELLEMEVGFFLPPPLKPDTVSPYHPESLTLDESGNEALRYCWDNIRTSGLGTANHFSTNWRFEPLITSNGEIGVLGISVPNHIRLDASFGRLITALADQVANILERVELSRMMSESRVREEREKLRAMLLSSVSHDLKTPLASIIGSLSVFNRLKHSNRLTDETAEELTATALDEAHRLDSFISNILDMTRIESGQIHFERDWIDPMEPINHLKKRLKQRLSKHKLTIEPPDSSVEIECDPMMTGQVIQNVVDNAAKYSPAGSEITVSLHVGTKGFTYKVRDQGAGIPSDKQEAVFDKYERLKQSDSVIAGTGLGLAICKAVMEKQGGSISAGNHPSGGAEFTIWFPQSRTKPQERSEKVA